MVRVHLRLVEQVSTTVTVYLLIYLAVVHTRLIFGKENPENQRGTTGVRKDGTEMTLAQIKRLRRERLAKAAATVDVFASRADSDRRKSEQPEESVGGEDEEGLLQYGNE